MPPPTRFRSPRAPKPKGPPLGGPPVDNAPIDGFTLTTTSPTLAGLIIAWSCAAGIAADMVRAQRTNYTIVFTAAGDRRKLLAIGRGKMRELALYNTGEALRAAWRAIQ